VKKNNILKDPPSLWVGGRFLEKQSTRKAHVASSAIGSSTSETLQDSGTCSEGFALRYIDLLNPAFKALTRRYRPTAFGGQAAPFAEKPLLRILLTVTFTPPSEA